MTPRDLKILLLVFCLFAELVLAGWILFLPSGHPAAGRRIAVALIASFALTSLVVVITSSP